MKDGDTLMSFGGRYLEDGMGGGAALAQEFGKVSLRRGYAS